MTRPLKVGVQLPEVERVVRWPELLDMVRAIEDLGYDSIWLGEHLLYRWPDRAPRGRGGLATRDGFCLQSGEDRRLSPARPSQPGDPAKRATRSTKSRRRCVMGWVRLERAEFEPSASVRSSKSPGSKRPSRSSGASREGAVTSPTHEARLQCAPRPRVVVRAHDGTRRADARITALTSIQDCMVLRRKSRGRLDQMRQKWTPTATVAGMRAIERTSRSGRLGGRAGRWATPRSPSPRAARGFRRVEGRGAQARPRGSRVKLVIDPIDVVERAIRGHRIRDGG